MKTHGFGTGIGWLLVVASGCASPPGAIFPAVESPIAWPPPPQPARIRYIGQLASSADLKPARSGWQAFGDLLGGEKSVSSIVSPIAVWMSPTEQLFVADSNGQVVHRFDLRQRTYKAIYAMRDRRLSMPVAVVGGTDGVIYIADAEHQAVHRFHESGSYLSDVPLDVLGQPAGLAYDAERHRLWVSDVANHRVIAVALDGQVERSIGQRGTAPGQFNYPTHLTVDGQGRLLVADSLNYRVQRFRPDGTLDLTIGQQGTAPGDFALPKGVAVDSDGHIYVVDARFENIQVFDDQGELLLSLGEEGGGPAEFWLPAGLCIDSANRIFVADVYNRRVQVFQYLAVQETPS